MERTVVLAVFMILIGIHVAYAADQASLIEQQRNRKSIVVDKELVVRNYMDFQTKKTVDSSKRHKAAESWQSRDPADYNGLLDKMAHLSFEIADSDFIDKIYFDTATETLSDGRVIIWCINEYSNLGIASYKELHPLEGGGFGFHIFFSGTILNQLYVVKRHGLSFYGQYVSEDVQAQQFYPPRDLYGMLLLPATEAPDLSALGDIDNDGKVGLPEAINALKTSVSVP